MKLIRIENILPYAAAAAAAISLIRSLAIYYQWLPYETGVFYLRPWFRFDSILVGCCTVILLSKCPKATQLLTALGSLLPGWVLWGFS